VIIISGAWFPAVSFGWRLHGRNPSLRIYHWIDNFKFRDWIWRNRQPGFLPLQVAYFIGAELEALYYNQQWINSYEPGQNPNPDLRWEKKKELNIGLDFTAIPSSDGVEALNIIFARATDLLWEFQVSVPPYLIPLSVYQCRHHQ
jgi:hypothetical protein